MRNYFVAFLLSLVLPSCEESLSDKEVFKINEDISYFYGVDKDYKDSTKIITDKNYTFYSLRGDNIMFVKESNKIINSNYKVLRDFPNYSSFFKVKSSIDSIENNRDVLVSDIFYISNNKYELHLTDSNGIILKDKVTVITN